ncbi:uncharacterized protein [Rhodnius prolixus]
MSPKIVNGSFAAIFYPDQDSGENWTKGWTFLTNIHKGSPARRKMLAKKQFSLDSRLDLVEYCLGINNPTAVLPTCTEFNITQEVSPTDCQENESTGSLEIEGPTRHNRSKSLGSPEKIEEEESTNRSNYTQKVCLKCGHLESTTNK